MNKGHRLKMSSQLGFCSSTDFTGLLLKIGSSSKSNQRRISGSSESRNLQKMVQKQCEEDTRVSFNPNSNHESVWCSNTTYMVLSSHLLCMKEQEKKPSGWPTLGRGGRVEGRQKNTISCGNELCVFTFHRLNYLVVYLHTMFLEQLKCQLCFISILWQCA